MTLGELVRKRRLELSLRQVDVAEAAEIGQNTLSEIERDKRTVPHHETLLRLAKVLRIDPSELYVAAGTATTSEQGRRVVEARGGYDSMPVDPTVARLERLLAEVDWEQSAGVRDGIIAMLERLPKRAKGTPE